MSVQPITRKPNLSFERTESLAVVDAFTIGRVSARTALKSFKNQGKDGYLLRAEICLQRAALNPAGSNRWFNLAQKNYAKAAGSGLPEQFTLSTPASAKALLRLGQLPLLHSMTTGRGLADPERMQRQVSTAYVNTVQVGTWLSHVMDYPGQNPTKLETSRKIAAHLCNEMGVLALVHRFTAKEGVASDMIGASALLGNALDTEPGGIARRRKWDVSIWTRSDQSRFKVEDASHRIRLQANEPLNFHDGRFASIIHDVNPARDLDVYGIPERYIGSQILHDCWAEITDPLHATASRRALNQQTERLVEILED